MSEFVKEDLEFHLPYQCNEHDLEVSYVIDCIFNKEMQDSWKPKVGNLIVGPTGNIFVISGYHHLHEDLGGTKYFFGGSSCNRNGGCLLDSTMCYTLNKDGL